MAKNKIDLAQKKVQRALRVFADAKADLDDAASQLEFQIKDVEAQQEALELLKGDTVAQLSKTLSVRDKIAEFVV